MKNLNEKGADGWVEKGIYLLLFLMLPASIIFALFSVREVLLPRGSADFHSYWFSGHFLRQGTDPYQAFFDRRVPSVPVHYVDGLTTEQAPVAQPGLAITPANTAPITLLLSLFSWLSWPSAKLLWLMPAWYQLVSAAMTLTLLGALLISLWRLKVMGQNPSG
ncbi:MAG: hypothetical protein HF973_14020 [Chloroflexi bacterium]|nr:hypothetical protein [Chloroflexota bacterium]